MHVFVTGATGFVGSYMLRELLKAGHTARCLMRNTDDELHAPDDDIERVKGDITDPRSLAGLVRGCDAVVHLVGIIEERPSKGVTFNRIHTDGTRHIVNETVDAGVDRFVLMSANGARADGVSAYQTSKWAAEEIVKEAGFTHWTIFRPSLVFGKPMPGQPEFASQLVSTLIKPFPVWPIFGDGLYEMQPISVEEVASAFVQALAAERAHGNTYGACGRDTFPYLEILDIIARGAGIEPKPKIYQPLWLVRPAVRTLGRWGLLPISPDQFEMLIEGNTCDNAAFYDDFDLTSIAFAPENLEYLRD